MNPASGSVSGDGTSSGAGRGGRARGDVELGLNPHLYLQSRVNPHLYLRSRVNPIPYPRSRVNPSLVREKSARTGWGVMWGLWAGKVAAGTNRKKEAYAPVVRARVGEQNQSSKKKATPGLFLFVCSDAAARVAAALLRCSCTSKPSEEGTLCSMKAHDAFGWNCLNSFFAERKPDPALGLVRRGDAGENRGCLGGLDAGGPVAPCGAVSGAPWVARGGGGTRASGRGIPGDGAIQKRNFFGPCSR